MQLNPLTPQYCFWQHFLNFFLSISFFSLICLLPIFATIAKHNKEEQILVFLISFLCFIGANFAISCLASLIVKSLYRQAHFKVLSDRIEYYRDFFALRIVDLKYKNIKEMSLTQNPIQKLYGVGTILLQSHASPQSYQKGRSGLKLYNIENPQEVFSFLKKEIDKVES